jgi:myo-inositol-1(or 4)-monophosphatase
MTIKASALPFSKNELSTYLDAIEVVANKAGKRLLTYQKKLSTLTIDYKQAQGVVSEADVEVENFIVKELKKIIPDAGFLAEESSYGKQSYADEAKKKLLWVIDPLDGTTNFLNNMDYFAVCISLCYYGKPIMGLVYRPRFAHTYRAFYGGGAFFRAGDTRLKRISVSDLKDKKLKNSLLSTGFATEKGVPFDQEFALFKKMMKSSRGVRRMGSAALDLCLLAEGIFDGFWERGLAPWDVAAAGLICQESGCLVTDYSKEDFSPFAKTIVVGQKSIHKQLIKLIAE